MLNEIKLFIKEVYRIYWKKRATYAQDIPQAVRIIRRFKK